MFVFGLRYHMTIVKFNHSFKVTQLDYRDGKDTFWNKDVILEYNFV